MAGKSLSRREFLRISALSAAGAALSACAQPTPEVVEVEKQVVVTKEVAVEVEKTVIVAATAPPPEDVVVRFLHDATPGETAWHEVTKADFEALHPNIEVRPEPIGSGWFDKTIAAIVAGIAPDIIVAYLSNYVGFATRGVFVDLTDWVEGWPDLDDIWPAALTATTLQGKIYTVPYVFDPIGFFVYNEILLDEEGIPYPDDTWTYDDLRDYCIALTKKDADGNTIQWGFNGAEVAAGWGHYRIYPVLYAYGGRWYSDDLTHLRLAEPEALEAITYLWELKVKHRVAPTPEQMGGMNHLQQFASGVVGYDTDGPWAFGSFRELISDPDLAERWDVGPVPSGPDGRYIWAAANGWGIWNGTKYPDEAMMLLEFLTDSERNKQQAQIGGRVPARRSAIDAFGDPTLPPKNQNLLPEMLDYAITPPLHPTKEAQVFAAVGVGWDRLMILEEGTPEEIFSEVVEEVDAILAEED